MPTVEVLVKPASYDCNLSCDYCFYTKTSSIYPRNENSLRMNDRILERLIAAVMAQSEGSPAIFAWQGGEPLLCGTGFFKNVFRLQKKYGRQGQVVSNAVQTNGTLITGSMAGLFSRYNVFVGLSLDGPARHHDTYRKFINGRGTHFKVMKAAELLRKKKVEFNILSTIGNFTAGKAADLYEWFVDHGFKWLQFIPATDRTFDGRFQPFSITPEQYGDFLCDLFDAWYNSGKPAASIRFFDNILELMFGLKGQSCQFQSTCGKYLVVEHNGDVYPCDFFVHPKWKLGNIMTHGVNGLLADSANRFGSLKAVTPSQCKECRWNFICHNGCLWYRNVHDGNMAGPDYLCPAYKKFFSHSYERFEILLQDLKKRKSRREQP